jgi:hypothetical protein
VTNQLQLVTTTTTTTTTIIIIIIKIIIIIPSVKHEVLGHNNTTHKDG